MQPYQYSRSRELFDRAAKVIPCGIYGHYSPAPLIPPSSYPLFTAESEGSRFRDVDGNEFIDYMCAFGPMILGYRHHAVEAAVQNQLKHANLTTGAPPLMVELAEYLVGLIDFADWAFFAKNGGDVTNYAIMIARDATQRKKIIMCRNAYHGVAQWMQAPGHHGLIEDDFHSIIRVPWNDVDAFKSALKTHAGEIAAFIATPYHVPAFSDSEWPSEGYWQQIDALCRREGVVIIVDDIRHGFRMDMNGSHEHFGFKPDLLCLGKALANGYPISALLGTDTMKNIAARVFYTGSFWFEAVPMAAAMANLKEMKRNRVTEYINAQGKKLLNGLAASAESHGYSLKVSGAPSMPYVRITDDESQMLHQAWCGECTCRGAYFTPHHNWFLSSAHNDDDIDQTLKIADEAFEVIRSKFGSGDHMDMTLLCDIPKD
jgi:glutamate-1-semialdehyde 2,1-aminomutase